MGGTTVVVVPPSSSSITAEGGSSSGVPHAEQNFCQNLALIFHFYFYQNSWKKCVRHLDNYRITAHNLCLKVPHAL